MRKVERAVLKLAASASTGAGAFPALARPPRAGMRKVERALVKRAAHGIAGAAAGAFPALVKGGI